MRHQAQLGTSAVAWSHFGLALALAASHEQAQSLPHFDEAIRLFSQSNGAADPMTLRSRSERALVLARLGKLAEAEREFAALAVDNFAGEQQFTHEARLAVLRSLQGRHEEAIALARACANGLKTSHAKYAQARSLATLGSVLLAANRPGEAIGPLQESTALFNESQVSGAPEGVEAAVMLDRARHANKH
jgi:tetratricopeptide (TPR) repeat protein